MPASPFDRRQQAVAPVCALLILSAGAIPVASPASVWWTAPGILAAAMLIAWAAESAQFFMAQGFALAILAWLQTLPEFAVEAVLAWKQQVPLLMANLTGALRLLTGLGWPMIYFTAAAFHRKRTGKTLGRIRLKDEQCVEVIGLAGRHGLHRGRLVEGLAQPGRCRRPDRDLRGLPGRCSAGCRRRAPKASTIWSGIPRAIVLAPQNRAHPRHRRSVRGRRSVDLFHWPSRFWPACWRFPHRWAYPISCSCNGWRRSSRNFRKRSRPSIGRAPWSAPPWR